jgi:hypothetical protein
MTTPIVVTIPVELNAGATGTALGGRQNGKRPPGRVT